MKIAYYGSCWPTNIGNAFVGLGVFQQLRAVLGPDVELHQIGALSPYVFRQAGKPQNSFILLEHMEFDYIVVAGMTQCVDYWAVNERAISAALEGGARLIMIGSGAGTYDERETERVRKYMERYPVDVFVSRDRFSYDAYADLAPSSFDGIDSAFFLNTYGPLLPVSGPSFAMATFDSMDVELVLDDGRRMRPAQPDAPVVTRRQALRRQLGRTKRRLLGHPEVAPAKPREIRLDLEGRELYLAHHAPWPDFTRESYFDYPETLMSDIPIGYLSLYGAADVVYSDRIHACIASLALGNGAQLFGDNVPRLRMFEQVGAGAVMDEPVWLEPDLIQRLRDAQLQFLSDVFAPPHQKRESA